MEGMNEKVLQCLNEIKASNDVIETFKKEKIDLDALALLKDDELQALGITAKGDRLKLKALSHTQEQENNSKRQREERIKELKEMIKQGKQRTSQSASASHKRKINEQNPPSGKRKGHITFQFGWKHWSEEKGVYVQRRLGGGGGTRKVSVPRDATFMECKKIAVGLFFPEDSTSVQFDKDKLLFSLGNFRGEKMNSRHNFSPEEYKNETGISPPRLYLLTKEVDMDDDDHALEKSVFASHTESKSGEKSKLLGSSSTRKSIKNDQDKAYKESLLADQAKSKKDKEKREENQDDPEMERALNAVRTGRVPPEPSADSESRVQIAIRHPILGLKTRYFLTTESMLAVYDWCGSLSLKPPYFSLSLTPECTVQPIENVQVYDQVVLHVRPEKSAVFIEESPSPTVSFKGFGPLTRGSNDDTLVIPPVLPELPDVIMIADENESTSNKVDTPAMDHAEYSTNNEELGSPASEVSSDQTPRVIYIRRSLILEDMIKAFSNGVPTSLVNIRFIDRKGEQEMGVDSGGLLRDALTGFWATFFERCTVGEDARVPQLRHDFQKSEWKAVGIILYLGIKQIGYFPTKLAKSFLVAFLFGENSLQDDELISSFLGFVSNGERLIIRRALDTFSEVDNDDIVDILGNFKCNRMASAGNFRELILEIAHREIIQAAQYVIECWAEIRPLLLRVPSLSSIEAVSQLYACLKPSNKKVLEMLTPPEYVSNCERETFSFLQRFIRGLSEDMLENFLRFTTGSNVMCVDKITIMFVKLEGAGRRPMAHTCGAILQVPSTYANYSEFRGEWSNVMRQGEWNIDFI